MASNFFPQLGKAAAGFLEEHVQPANVTTPSMKQGACFPVFSSIFINAKRRCIQQVSLEKRSRYPKLQ